MTNFAYITGIPATNNNPSDDQPDMLNNNDNGALIWETDHIGFNAPNGGLHQQSSYPAFSSGIVPVGNDPNEGSVAYPAAGVADPTIAQYYFRNVNSTLPLSCIKAFLTFANPNAVLPSVPFTGFNIDSVSSTNPPGFLQFAITLTANSFKNTQPVITLITPNAVNLVVPPFFQYSWAGNVLTITINSSSSITALNVVILQI